MSTQKPPHYKWYVLLLLTGVSTFAYIDKQLIVILQEPIKQEFDLSDTQLGLLSGLAFTITFILFGIPVAHLSDKLNRKNILAAALAFWSVVTSLTSFATSYISLLIARMSVGLGETGNAPPAYSILPDYFPKHQRARAFSIYNMGVYIGILISFSFGGYLVDNFGWRQTLFIMGIPGLIFSLLIYFTLKEPIRGQLDQKAYSDEKASSIGQVLKALFTKKTFIFLCLGAGFHTLIGVAFGNWAPSFFSRVHQMSFTAIGTWLSLVIGICGSAGAFLGGYLADKYGQIDKKWYILIPAIGVIGSLPFSFFLILSGSKTVMLISHCFATLLFSLYIGPCFVVVHDLVGIRMRATASAIFAIALNLFGMGTGPLLAGALSDFLEPTYGVFSIRWSLFYISFLKIIAFIFLLFAVKYYKKESARE